MKIFCKECKENKLDVMQKRLFKTCKGLIIHHPIYMTDVYNTGITAVVVRSVHHHDYVKMQHLKYNVVSDFACRTTFYKLHQCKLGKDILAAVSLNYFRLHTKCTNFCFKMRYNYYFCSFNLLRQSNLYDNTSK